MSDIADDEKPDQLTLTREQSFFDRSGVLRLFILVIFFPHRGTRGLGGFWAEKNKDVRLF